MAKIPRKTQKIFAENADNNGVFGSAADNTKILSNDIATIQSKAAYSNGWDEAVIGDKKFPPLEEFQSLQYMWSTQLAYIFENGIPEYDSGTTYYEYSIVRQTGTYQLYGSLVANNVGNALNDTDYWEELINLNFAVAQATETTAGIAEIATQAEVNAGTDDERFVTPLKLAQFKIPSGAVFAYALGTSAPSGYVMVGGRTIGSAASGATERANADTEDLFIGLWNNYTNTLLPIQDSSGNPTTRGVSAAADFSANKRLPTLDARGRVIAGLDNMGGTPAGRLTGQTGGVNGLTSGNSGGGEIQTLLKTHLPATPTQMFRGTVQNSVTGSDGTFSIDTANDQGLISGPNLGDSTPHNNVQPTLILPFIMKL